MPVSIHHGDNITVLKTFADRSVDSIVTDPPYGLSAHTAQDVINALSAWMQGREYLIDKKGFMGKTWDSFVPGPELWREAYRVLKPGGHLLCFAGSRTDDLMGIAIRLAGFEIRDKIMWLYGCLDEETKAVTRSGDKHYSDIVVGEEVLCYDPTTCEYSYQPVLEVMTYDHANTAYRLVGDFGEQVVTRNHRCIVERSGREEFAYAETLELEVRVPFLENLRELQCALHGDGSISSSSKDDMQQNLHEGHDRKEKFRGEASRSAQREEQSNVRGMWDRVSSKHEVVGANEDPGVLPEMQRCDTRSGVEGACPQRASRMDGGIDGVISYQDARREEPVLAGRDMLWESEGQVYSSEDQVCNLSGRIPQHGTEEWLRAGTSVDGCEDYRSEPHSERGCSSYQSRCDGQSTREFDAVLQSKRPQGIREWKGHSAHLVRVVPFWYEGKVWCLRVPTGAFVAVRNGVAFPTGNSGMPKSLDVAKAIDKAGGLSPADQSVLLREKREASGLSRAELAELIGCTEASVRDWEEGRARAKGRSVEHIIPSPDYRERLAELLGYSADERHLIGVVTDRRGDGTVYAIGHSGLLTEGGNTEAAARWKGWGTALKPAFEPVIVARKPLIGTVAETVLRYGTGAINIDACRVPSESRPLVLSDRRDGNNTYGAGLCGSYAAGQTTQGRWPANVAHDGSEDVEAAFDQFGAKGGGDNRGVCSGKRPGGFMDVGAEKGEGEPNAAVYDDHGTASRFFYCAKASKQDRAGSKHPTVKPVALMRWLVRMVTPPGGVVLDPFAGSGTTGQAAVEEGFNAVLIEREDEYVEDIRHRLLMWTDDGSTEALVRVVATANRDDDADAT